jgi:hypothetical protein
MAIKKKAIVSINVDKPLNANKNITVVRHPLIISSFLLDYKIDKLTQYPGSKQQSNQPDDCAYHYCQEVSDVPGITHFPRYDQKQHNGEWRGEQT